MSPLLATLFVHPVTLGGWQKTIMLLPLCLSIAVVYKSIKCPALRDIPRTSLILWATILIGMYVVGIALWGLYEVIV